MSSFLADAWAFLTARRDHPIYQHELAGWSYLRIWRGLRRGCLPLMGAALAASVLCCGSLSVSLLDNPRTLSEEWLLVPFSALVGLAVSGEIIRWLTGLLATALTSTAISSEVEAETYHLLRATPIPAREIVLAKFSAAFRQFRLPLIVVALTRATFVLGVIALAVILLASEVTASGPSAPAPTPAVPTPAVPLPGPAVAAQAVSVASATLAVLLAAVVWFAYYLAAPTLGTLIFAALGMLASSWARTRAGGLIGAAGLRVALWVGSYMTGQFSTVFFSLLALPAFALPTTPLWLERVQSLNPALLVLAGAVGAIAWVLLLVIAQLGVTLALLYVSARRAERIT
jgi:hypothetical protein